MRNSRRVALTALRRQGQVSGGSNEVSLRYRLLLVLPVLIPFAITKSEAQGNDNERHILRLADIMSGTQLRHMKLWFAGQSSNWELAAYYEYWVSMQWGLADQARCGEASILTSGSPGSSSFACALPEISGG